MANTLITHNVAQKVNCLIYNKAIFWYGCSNVTGFTNYAYFGKHSSLGVRHSPACPL